MAVHNKLLKLKAGVTRKVWGGSRLEKIKSIPKGSEPVGETWEISIHKDGPSKINHSDFDNKPLSDHLSEKEMPYLVKLIDTSDNLSVQVHPGDEYAKKYENSMGKTECWLILDAAPGAGIYLGLKEGVTKDVFESALKSGGELHTLLNFYEVSAGDFFYVPAGAIHAIGENVFLAEVQQSSGITYRVWDWNRVDENGKGRELHIKKALDVINFDIAFNNETTFRVKTKLLDKDGELELVDHKDFNLALLKIKEMQELSLGTRASSLLCLSGEVEIKNEKSESVFLSEYDAMTTLSDLKVITATPKEESILVFVK